jgi:hypothetical protein
MRRSGWPGRLISPPAAHSTRIWIGISACGDGKSRTLSRSIFCGSNATLEGKSGGNLVNCARCHYTPTETLLAQIAKESDWSRLRPVLRKAILWSFHKGKPVDPAALSTVQLARMLIEASRGSK